MRAYRSTRPRVASILVISLVLASLATPAATIGVPVAPANDNWASAPQIVESNFPYSASVNTAGATNEPGESQPCGAIGKTVWYKFTPPFGQAGGGGGRDYHFSFDADTTGSDFD